jgi:hypothetical protein
MKNRNWNPVAATMARLFLLVTMVATCAALHAQAPTRFVGTVTAINGTTITVKTDAGDSKQVEVPATAVMKRLAPGQKDLSAAETIHVTDLATGDRVLVKLDPDATGAMPQALQVVAMKQTDIAQKQQQEREEWQRNGTGGLVKSVDAAAGVVMVTTGAGQTAKTVTVHITKTTVLKRYAANSIRFADAQPAPLDAIHAGDQLQVLGQKNADGTEITAAEVVSGSFRNISGVVASIDGAASTFTVKDLLTKKNVTVHVTPDAEMRRLPDAMAKMIAARLKGGAAGPGGTAAGGEALMPAHAQAGGTPGSAPAGAGPNGGMGAGQAHRNGGGGLSQILDRAPAVKLSDLQKDEAIMLVSTEGTNEVTAIKLLVGVEPLLESPDASRNLLANWSMGSGGAEAAAQ